MRVASSGSDVSWHVPFDTTGWRAKDTCHSHCPVTSPRVHMGMGVFLHHNKKSKYLDIHVVGGSIDICIGQYCQ